MADIRNTFIFNISEGVVVKFQTNTDGDIFIDDELITDDAQFSQKLRAVSDAALA